MYLLPARQQFLLPDFDEPHSLDHFTGLHPVNLDDPHWPTHLPEPDDYFAATLYDVHVGWSVFTRREEDANRKTI